MQTEFSASSNNKSLHASQSEKGDLVTNFTEPEQCNQDLLDQRQIIKDLSKKYESSSSYALTLERNISAKDKEIYCREEENLQKDLVHSQLVRENTDLTGKVQELETRLEILSLENENMAQGLAFFRRQPLPVHTLISNYENNVWGTNVLRKTILESMIANETRFNRVYAKERDFWLDIYNNISHRQFNRMSAVLNGPWRSTVESWQERTSFEIFGLNWSTISAYSKSMYPSTTTLLPDCDELKTNEYGWGNEANVMKTSSAFPHNCMIDETACKIIVQFDPQSNRLYGFSAMPRFVLLRGIKIDFSIMEFFKDLKIQYDKKGKKHVAGIKKIDLDHGSYLLG